MPFLSHIEASLRRRLWASWKGMHHVDHVESIVIAKDHVKPVVVANLANQA